MWGVDTRQDQLKTEWIVDRHYEKKLIDTSIDAQYFRRNRTTCIHAFSRDVPHSSEACIELNEPEAAAGWLDIARSYRFA